AIGTSRRTVVRAVPRVTSLVALRVGREFLFPPGVGGSFHARENDNNKGGKTEVVK
ncbi:AGAP009427-PA, partial [Anopheles gambiae str. PEST]